MYDTVLQTVAAAGGGQLWRPILILGVIAALMGLIVVAQLTNPERRRAERTDDGDEQPDADPGPQDSPH